MNENPMLRVFVYGTLKRGFHNHERLCQAATACHPATTWGQLYHLPAGYPALIIPDGHALALGTGNPLADARTQQNFKSAETCRPEGDWDTVHGEVLAFEDAESALPPLDWLEGFTPGEPGLYDRVLIQVQSQNRWMTAWVYVMHEVRKGVRVKDGNWQGDPGTLNNDGESRRVQV